jgi:integrase
VAGNAAATQRRRLDAGTLAIEITCVVINGQVVESDGKTENAQRVIALDPFTLAALRLLVEQLDTERAELGPDDVRHSYATAGRDAKIDWKALSVRIGHADVAFTMKQYVQADLEADRQVANTLAELIIGGSLPSVVIEDQGHDDGQGDAA